MRKFIVDTATGIVKFETTIPYQVGQGETLVETDDLSILIFPEVEIKVPLTITRMNLKIQLLKRSITIPDVFATIDSIPNSMFSDIDKEIAKIKFTEAVYFDRDNADLNLVAVLLGLSQTELDQIFIDGN
jgi:hypothetical protein